MINLVSIFSHSSVLVVYIIFRITVTFYYVCYFIMHVTSMECTRGHGESMHASVRRERMERLTAEGGEFPGMVVGVGGGHIVVMTREYIWGNDLDP